MFKIDGVEYSKITVGITRKFEVVDGENAGRLLNGNMVRDLIGTYYNYTATVSAMSNDMETYNKLYEVISAPVEYHIIEAPYGNSVLRYKAYITNGSDEFQQVLPNGDYVWQNLTFDFIAMTPNRYPA